MSSVLIRTDCGSPSISATTRLLRSGRSKVGVPRRAHPTSRRRQLVADGRRRSVRPLLGDLLRSRAPSSVPTVARSMAMRMPVRRDLEPRLHAVRPAGRWIASASAQAIDRHRCGPRAHPCRSCRVSARSGRPTSSRRFRGQPPNCPACRPGNRPVRAARVACGSSPIMLDRRRCMVSDGVFPSNEAPRLRSAPHPAPAVRHAYHPRCRDSGAGRHGRRSRRDHGARLSGSRHER